MKLDEFVAETLKQIATGIVCAQKATSDARQENGVCVSPFGVEGKPHIEGHYATGIALPRVEMISFDVAVSMEKDAKGGINMLGIEAGGGGSSSAENRISFSVPMILPYVKPSNVEPK